MNTEQAMNDFLDGQVALYQPFSKDGRLSVSEESFRAALQVAYCMGGVHALTSATKHEVQP